MTSIVPAAPAIVWRRFLSRQHSHQLLDKQLSGQHRHDQPDNGMRLSVAIDALHREGRASNIVALDVRRREPVEEDFLNCKRLIKLGIIVRHWTASFVGAIVDESRAGCKSFLLHSISGTRCRA